MNVTIFKNLFNSQDVPYIVPIEKVIDRIKSGSKSKELIEQIRICDSKKERDSIKKKLPCILFSGVFNERNSNSCTQHSGLMILDFDGYENESILKEQFEILKKIEHIYLIFVSPSNNGLKAVLRVSNELDKHTHPKVHKEFKKEFKIDYFDVSNCNIDRVCYESYDPNIYINENATIYNPILYDEGFNVSEKVPLIPITNEDKIIEKIMLWNWNKDFVEGERNSFIFDLAGAFCEYGITEQTAENYILNNVVIGDFSFNEAKTTIKSAYKKRQFESKFFEDYIKIDRIKTDLKKGKDVVLNKYKITDDVFDEIKDEAEHDDFWYINDKNKIQINVLKYKLFLERNGFKKYFPNESEKPTWLYIKSNKVVETSTEKIKDFVLNYLINRGELEVWNYCATYQNLFSENFLSMLETIKLLMLNDKKYKSFIAFENGILEVTKDNIKLNDYIDVDGYVWQSQIIQREWKKLNNDDNDYKKFINNISNNESLPIECTIGYLLSTYKNKMNNKAVILNDEVISDNPEGGTGKGLFIQGIKQIRRVSILDGKTFDDKKSFPYQTVSPETQVLVFDDVKKNFDFESKFSLVTEGMTLERKNKDAIKLTVEESPKMVLSTNYAIKGEGNSHDRRRHEIEIAQYYGKKITPYDEFGRELFDEWSDLEFCRFDNYMINCLQLYLKEGLIEQNAKNIKLRKFIAETSMEFYEWIEDVENFPRNKRNDKGVYFDNFTREYKDFERYLRRNKFTIWVKKYATYKGYEYKDGNSNGLRWFEINNGLETNDNDIEF